MATLDIKESRELQGQATTADNIMAENFTRVYPYKMINANHVNEFLKPNTVSIVSISNRNSWDFNGELYEDEKGHAFLNLVASVDINGMLISSTTTSTDKKDYKEIKQFTGITNMWDDSLSDVPCVFFINEPYNRAKFESGEQIAYLAPSVIKSAPEVFDELNVMVGEETINNWSEVTFIDLNSFEEQYNNAKVIFTLNTMFSENVSSFDGNKGISLGIENHTLIHSIKAKGTITEVDASGNELYSEYGDIDLFSKEKWAPFKMTPTSTREKLTMYADWFDYDSVMPFVNIEKFKQGGSLAVVINNPDDLKMVEDMIALSAGYASNWDSAPVITSGSETGKIKPDFRVGHAGIKVSVIAGKDPIKVIDGIYENHLRKHPAFETDISRVQPVKEILNALSRYIYSSYSIGKGQNSFNMAYLPWYLEPHATTPITFGKEISIPNPDKGEIGTVKTFVIDDGVKFQAKTLYFHDKFSDDIPSKGKADLLLPTKLNISNQKLLQTDRKLTLPELPDNIVPINKLPLPGDINTKSENDLRYLFYLPIQDQTTFEEFMLNKLTQHSSAAVGTEITVQLPRGVDGKVWTQAEANQAVLNKQPGTLKTPPQISNPTTTTSLKMTNVGSDTYTAKYYIEFLGQKVYIGDGARASNVAKMSGQKIIDGLNKIVEDPASISGIDPIHQYGLGNINFQISHSEFTPAVVTTTSQTVSTYSFQGREVMFDKMQWQRFLNKFNILPNGFNRYSFDTYNDYKIKKIEELTIQSVWGNEIEIMFGTGRYDYIKIPLFNKDDETIATQRVLFI